MEENRPTRSLLTTEKTDRPERPERGERLEDLLHQNRMLELEVSKMKIKVNQLKAKAKGYEELCESLVAGPRTAAALRAKK